MTVGKSNVVLRALGMIWVISTLICFSYQPGVLGFTAYGTRSQEYVAAGVTPAELILALIGLTLFVTVARAELRISEFEIAPVWRRYIALMVDFWFSVFTLGALFAVIPLVLEARRTGTFRWGFARDYSAPSDWVGVALVLIAMATMVAYFILTLANRRQTVGRWMTRIATVNVDGSAIRLPLAAAFRRTYVELRELGSFSTLWTMARGRDRSEVTRYDKSDPFIVVRY